MAILNSKKKSKYSTVPLKLRRKMSISTFLKRYENYEGSKVELDDGSPYMMGGASPIHEWLISQLTIQFGNYLRSSPCQPYGSNLYLKTEEHSMREPDLTIICDHSKFNGKVYEGIPRLIVEIVSPSSRITDLYTKKGEYYRLGVREYWVVMSKDEVRVNIWSEDEYIEKVFKSVDGFLKVPVQIEDWDLVVEINESRIPKEILE
ncbi:MAG: Uma2 family endonuclease [Treponema sp.]|jgi:Uma2 family endonuclease|nr:Uma2 family endonuclease [Treponema sp.]